MLQFCANSAARPYFLCDVMTGNHISILHTNCITNDMSAQKKSASAKSGGFYCVAGGPNHQSCKNSSSTEGISMHVFPVKRRNEEKMGGFCSATPSGFSAYSIFCAMFDSL